MAEKLLAQGHKVYLSGRRSEPLQDIANRFTTNAIALPLDVTRPEQLRQAMERIDQPIHRLILSAGNCEYLDSNLIDTELVERQIRVNYLGAVNTIAATLPLLRRASNQFTQTGFKPQIVAISSLATAAPFPRAEAYGASKAALNYFIESLAIDLAPENIDTCLVQPGFVDTELTRRNDFAMPWLMSPQQAADIILSGMKKTQRNISFPKRLAWSLSIAQRLPGLWQKMHNKNIAKRPESSP